MNRWLRRILFPIVCGIVIMLYDRPSHQYPRNRVSLPRLTTSSNPLDDQGRLKSPGYVSENEIEWSDEAAAPGTWDKLRYKKWDYYAVNTHNLTVSVAMVDVGYSGNCFINIIAKGRTPITIDKLIPPWEPYNFSSTPVKGFTKYVSDDLFVLFNNNQNEVKSVILKYKNDIDINMVFSHVKHQEGLVSYSPLNDDGSQYVVSNKQYNYKVFGTVQAYNETYAIAEQSGMMDWSRGFWPYSASWIWASGQGIYNGKYVGLNLGALSNCKYTDDHIVLGDTLIKLGRSDIRFGNQTNPWIFTTEPTKNTNIYAIVEFFPDIVAEKNINYLVIRSDLKQIYGTYNGNIVLQDKFIKFSIRGVLELHSSRL